MQNAMVILLRNSPLFFMGSSLLQSSSVLPWSHSWEQELPARVLPSFGKLHSKGWS